MTTMGTGILGRGYIGATHAWAITRSVSNARVVVVAGGRRAPTLAGELGVDREPSLDALLSRSDLDAVIVATPHSLHCRQTVQALRAGTHVLVEKPIATRLKDCNEMILAAAQADRVLMVAHTQRFREGNAQARRLLDAGVLGEVLAVEDS